MRTPPKIKINSVDALEAEMRRSDYVTLINSPLGPLFIAGNRQCVPAVVKQAIESGRLCPQHDGLFGEPQTWKLREARR